MAAGLGFKDFQTGEVLTAADVDGYLMQGIWVFASAAARDAAVTLPQEGNACYLKDTNQVLTYSGSAWVAVGGGSPLTTKGDLYTFSTVDARLGVGANGTTLVADSSTATGLVWSAPAGGGKVLQVVQATATTEVNTSSATYVDAGLSGSITPSSASSKVLVLVSQPLAYYRGGEDATAGLQLIRGSTTISETTGIRLYVQNASNLGIQGSNIQCVNFLDTPATTSATTYKMQIKRISAAGTVIEAQFTDYGASTATMILLEIGA